MSELEPRENGMSGAAADRDAPEAPPSDDEVPPPIGTIFFATLYVMVMAGMWGAIYLLMLER